MYWAVGEVDKGDNQSLTLTSGWEEIWVGDVLSF